ncbi:hypothetical protein VTK56DRAFT_5999 [Thermocarpiscus australiensis]
MHHLAMTRGLLLLARIRLADRQLCKIARQQFSNFAVLRPARARRDTPPRSAWPTAVDGRIHRVHCIVFNRWKIRLNVNSIADPLRLSLVGASNTGTRIGNPNIRRISPLGCYKRSGNSAFSL